MQMVITRVQVKPGAVDACAALFGKTNPDLVRNQPDWLEARMVVDRDTDTITVMALWQNAHSYHEMRNTSAFRDVMQGFGEFFASPPDVSINDVLVDMTADCVQAKS